MSEPVTNVEIEDVLSSIRRLVSDGDKARTRDPAPIEGAVEFAREAPIAAAAAPESDAEPETTTDIQPDIASARPDKLVLTPAYLVSDNGSERQKQGGEDEAETRDAFLADTSDIDPNDTDEHEVESDAQQTQPLAADGDESSDPEEWADTEHTSQEEPLTLTGMVWDAETEDEPETDPSEFSGSDAAEAPETSTTTPDRSSLVATIAELEAAVSADANEYEPEGNEPMSEQMGETIAWPGAMARRFHADEDAEIADEDEAVDVAADGDAAPQAEGTDEAYNDERVTTFHRASPDDQPVAVEPSDAEKDRAAEAAYAAADIDNYDDEDLDGLLEAGGVTLDDAALRELVADVVREELTGPLGERITRNVRKLVRREIYRVLSSQEFD